MLTSVYTKKGIKVGNMAGCAALCFEDSKCKFWTYNPRYNESISLLTICFKSRVSKCWMKTSDQGKSPSTKGSVSGQKACGAPGDLHFTLEHQTPRIPYSCYCSYSVTKSALWQYLGNQAWYHRSAGVKTTGKKFWIRKFKIQKKKCRKWSKMVKNGQKWSKMVKMVKMV